MTSIAPEPTGDRDAFSKTMTLRTTEHMKHEPSYGRKSLIMATPDRTNVLWNSA